MNRERVGSPRLRVPQPEPERPALPRQFPASESNAAAILEPQPALPTTDTLEPALQLQEVAAVRDEVSRSTQVPTRQRIRTLLASPDGIRQALLLNEILGPPKALRKLDGQ